MDVDNMIILANNEIQLKWLELELVKEFEMNAIKKLKYFREMEFEKIWKLIASL